MASNPRRKSDAARRANQVIRSRTVLVMLLLGIVTFAVLFWKLYDIQIRQHSVLQEKAIEQQTRSAVVNASRGTVYDRNLNTLAISATAEDVNISPMRIAEFVESQKEKQEKAAKKAADKGETYTAPILRDQAYIAKGLSRILGVEQETLETRMTKTNYDYWNIKKRADQTVSDEVRRFINGEIDPDGNEVPESDRVKLQGVWLQPSSKRYYLYGSLASGILGFVNSDGVGSVGLEAKYDDTLTGTAGYTISARNAAGTELMYNYEQIFDAENGHSLVLTLDANGFTALQLNDAYSEYTNSTMVAGIISLIRRYMLGTELVSKNSQLSRAFDKLNKMHKFTPAQQKWLDIIRSYMQQQDILSVEAFKEDKRLQRLGGYARAQKIFADDLDNIVSEFNGYLYEDGGKTA